MTFSVSILISTLNRANDLRETLGALHRVRVPAGSRCELIVVDGGSTDGTEQVARGFGRAEMPVRYICEAGRGKSHALNTGLGQSRGEILLLTDDDVRPPSNWIEEMCGPIARGEGDAVGGGVKMAPHLKREWMDSPYPIAFADTTQLSPTEWTNLLIGANMAFSRRVLEKVPSFDTELGPGALGAWEETLFALQMAQAGLRVVARPEVVVEHHFQKSRLGPEPLAARVEYEGRSCAYVCYHWRHDDLCASALGLLKMKKALLQHKRARRRLWPHAEGLPLEELQIRHNIAFMEQARTQAGRPRLYEKHGLVKIPPGV